MFQISIFGQGKPKYQSAKMFFINNWYYISLVLQAICAIHCIRKGNQGKWIWIIVFLPLIGCIAYIFTEIFNERDLKNVQSGIGSIFGATGIKKLEENLRFSDTFRNKVALADAYFAAGYTDKAIALYESSLTGSFTENEHVRFQLILAYFEKQRYSEVITFAKKLYKFPQFTRSRAHMFYALALEQAGETEQAEKEFKIMKGRFSYFEPRYNYGLFLVRAGRLNDAKQVFTEMINEAGHLTSYERRNSRPWVSLAKDELKKMETKAVSA